MAINSYDTLKTAVINWMNRGDLAAVVPDFISLAEVRIAADLRVRRMLKTATLDTVAGAGIALPAGWLEFKTVHFNGRPLEFMTLDQLAGRFGDQTGEPFYYSISGESIVFGPTPSDVFPVTVQYYEQLDTLETVATNWLLTLKPNLYLYAALGEASLYVKKPEHAASWFGMYEGIVQSMRTEDATATHSGAPLVVRAG